MICKEAGVSAERCKAVHHCSNEAVGSESAYKREPVPRSDSSLPISLNCGVGQLTVRVKVVVGVGATAGLPVPVTVKV